MNDPRHKKDDQELYEECLKKAEGNEARAMVYYNHRQNAVADPDCEDMDQREKWPMLAPLLILYTLGTVGVLLLVYGFLAQPPRVVISRGLNIVFGGLTGVEQSACQGDLKGVVPQEVLAIY